jgi:hypothetical protein
MEIARSIVDQSRCPSGSWKESFGHSHNANVVHSASYLLHEYQLLATMTSSDPADIEPLARSKIAIVRLIQMMVDILGMFPISHLPELSPSALYCPYMAARLSLQLDRVNGVKASPTLAPGNFELILQSLRQFSQLWKCTGESSVLHLLYMNTSVC